jgi:hypothetical protein
MRKSRELRLSQSVQLLEDCTKVGLSNDYRMRFVRDMISRLDRGKGLSKKQRSWLDGLIAEGVPQPMGDPKLLKEIQDAAGLDGMQHRSQVLQDFAGYITRGKDLSPKQESFLQVMLKEADEIRTNGKFCPQDVGLLNDARAILSKKNEWYFTHRGGTAKALHTVASWLDWNSRKEAMDMVKEKTGQESNYLLEDEPQIDEWSCNKVLLAVKGPLSQLTDGKHPTGAMRYVGVTSSSVPIPAIVVAEPKVNYEQGIVCQDLLVNGEVIEVAVSSIRKRR